jgi:chromosome partitioning protein
MMAIANVPVCTNAQLPECTMNVVAVAMQKGGVGKSTLTRCLSVAAVEAGLNVVVLDMDNQQSTKQWRDRRDAALPVVLFCTEIDLPRELSKAEAAGCDLVIIDTPPARSTEAPAAVEASDLVLMPCTPDIEAYEQLPRTVRLARTTGKPAFAVLTMATPNSVSEVATAKEVFKAIGAPMAPPVIHRLKVHRDASRLGSTPLELEPEGNAAAESVELWNWLSAELQLSTRALVHNRTSAHVRRRIA